MNGKQRTVDLRFWNAALAIACAAAVCRPLAAGQVASLDDVEYWIGAGANRAALVIDWQAGSALDESLVWGYRWDGQVHGEDMLLAVLRADPRLFAKLSAAGVLGFRVYGVGYDASGDGQFSLTDDASFDEDGLAVTGLPGEDAAAVDPADWYDEGWFTGVWSYATARGEAWESLAWSQSFTGPRGRVLENNSWDGWTFASPIVLNSFPQNPHVAEAATAPNSADFNGDGVVDGADFLIWQRGFGTHNPMPSQGDANGDGVVDRFDLAVWQSDAGAPRPLRQPASQALPAPEPTSAILWRSLAAMAFSLLSPWRRRSHDDDSNECWPVAVRHACRSVCRFT